MIFRIPLQTYVHIYRNVQNVFPYIWLVGAHSSLLLQMWGTKFCFTKGAAYIDHITFFNLFPNYTIVKHQQLQKKYGECMLVSIKGFKNRWGLIVKLLIQRKE